VAKTNVPFIEISGQGDSRRKKAVEAINAQFFQ
jgi:hypothetical protein